MGGGPRPRSRHVTVRKVDERFYTTKLTARIPAASSHTTDLALAGGELWVSPTYGILTRIDAGTGSHRRAFDTGHQPMVVAAGGESVGSPTHSSTG